MFAADTLAPLGEVVVGDHPNAMLLSKDGTRLFVACANTNAVWVDRPRRAHGDRADLGRALSRTRRSERRRTAWRCRPTAARCSSPTPTTTMSRSSTSGSRARARSRASFRSAGIRRRSCSRADGIALVRAGRQGAHERSQPARSAARRRARRRAVHRQHDAGRALDHRRRRTRRRAPGDDTARLRAHARTPTRTRLTPADAPVANPDPRPRRRHLADQARVLRHPREPHLRPGPRRPAAGNGDPSLALFGEEITPNAHALAREFTLFDNFYVDAEVSYDGHAFSMGAYATDVVEKLWPTNYGGRGTPYLSEGGYKMRDQYGNFSAPPHGYIWDFAKRAGVSVRSYGEFARLGAEKAARSTPTVPGLEGLVHPSYPPFDLERARCHARRHLARGVPQLRARRQSAAALDHAARQRSHQRHVARHADAARDGRRERSRARPNRRGDLEQPLLEGLGDLRHRR